MRLPLFTLALATLFLTACSSTPARHTAAQTASNSGGYLANDGPGDTVPANLADTPDAVPRFEPLHRYANRPYKVLGKEYTPLTHAGDYKARGIASWYGKKFHGQHTTTGEIYDMYAMSAAHPTLPLPSYARVTNLTNQKSIVVRVNDRGPFMHDRLIDLSYAAAYKLGITGAGNSEVEVVSIAPDSVSSALPAIEPVQSTPLEATVNTPITLPLATLKTPTVTNKSSTKISHENVYLQLGAFKTESSAKHFMAKMRSKLGHSAQTLSLHQQAGMVRVRLGTYNNADEARNAADKLHAKLGVKAFVSKN